MQRDWSHYVDILRDDIWQNHSQIHIVDFDFYSVDVFNRCENGNDVLVAVSCVGQCASLLKVIPVEWIIPFLMACCIPRNRRKRKEILIGVAESVVKSHNLKV